VLKEKPLFIVPKTGQIAIECQEFELKCPSDDFNAINSYI